MEIYATLTATASIFGLFIVFSVLAALAKDHKAAQHRRDVAISHEEMRQIRADIRKYGRVDKSYKPRTIGGKR